MTLKRQLALEKENLDHEYHCLIKQYEFKLKCVFLKFKNDIDYVKNYIIDDINSKIKEYHKPELINTLTNSKSGLQSLINTKDDDVYVIREDFSTTVVIKCWQLTSITTRFSYKWNPLLENKHPNIIFPEGTPARVVAIKVHCYEIYEKMKYLLNMDRIWGTMN